MRLPTAAAYVLMVALTLVSAWSFSGTAEKPLRKWQQSSISFYDGSDRPRAVRAAIEKWNETGLDLRFRLVDSRSAADVLIRSVRKPSEFPRSCRHDDTIGCAPIGGRSDLPFRKPRMTLIARRPGERDEVRFSATVAHEIGHLLSLYHRVSKCALMDSRSHCRARRTVRDERFRDCPAQTFFHGAQLASMCVRRTFSRYLCGPTPAELSVLYIAYGRTPRAGSYDPFCYETRDWKWRGWCVWPQWRPSGGKRPGFLEQASDGRWRCGPQAPRELVSEWMRRRVELDARITTLSDRRGPGGTAPGRQQRRVRALQYLRADMVAGAPRPARQADRVAIAMLAAPPGRRGLTREPGRACDRRCLELETARTLSLVESTSGLRARP